MKLKQPSWPKDLPSEGVLGLATLGPIGMRMRAPGTWGSAVGVLFFVVCCFSYGIVENLIASALLAYFAVGICGEAEIRMGRRDPGEVILDEFVAMPLCFLGWQMIVGPGLLEFLGLLIAGFALFRFYDIKKPLVINSLQDLPGGWGIVIDDTAAALATCATLHLAHAVWALAFWGTKAVMGH
jgi:phosphatidylglycerophosphatase A